ncbi:hypothetical protein SI65_05833 [Aspergillus cristatus]|uniref:Uncharacterized protein n=1 Tax=Aspergillus cristatus TaxID=573508 RepID=A0A1E3BFP2_ASPCR|nr:hypothetical protein SI65_05833 [Aspergillus cristatus]
MKDYLYDPPRRHRTIEIIHDTLVRAGKIIPSRQRRFLNPKEAQRLKAQSRKCKHPNEFMALAKMRRCNFWRFREFMKVYYEDPACEQTIEQFIIEEANMCVGQVRDLLRKEELSIGIQWPDRTNIITRSGADQLVLAYVELSKVTDSVFGSIDNSQCDMYWLLMGRFYPGSKQRIQPIAYTDNRQGRLDAWVDF